VNLQIFSWFMTLRIGQITGLGPRCCCISTHLSFNPGLVHNQFASSVVEAVGKTLFQFLLVLTVCNGLAAIKQSLVCKCIGKGK
jgi:hypothetical protein